MKFSDMQLKELINKYRACKGNEPLTEHYPDVYERHFGNIREDVKSVIEIGVQGGGSVKVWRDYFPNAQIYGVDISPKCKKFEEDRIQIVIGDQSDPKFLKTLPNADVIIDDGGHRMHQQRTSFVELLSHASMVYVVEDLCTSYWPKFGGKLHSQDSMVSLLVDNVNRAALTERRSSDPPSAVDDLGIKAIHFYLGICFVEKVSYA